MELLRHNKKHGRYTELQKRMILWDYSEHKSIREISRKYKASISSIYNFIKNDQLRTNTNCCQLVEQTSTWQLNKNKKDFIENLVRPPTYPLTIDKINKELRKTFGAHSRKRDIKEFLKNSLHYSFKKGGSTTKKGGWYKTKQLQSIFSSRILKEIMDNKLIVNIDESSF